MDKLVITDEAVVLNGVRLNCVTEVQINITPENTKAMVCFDAEVRFLGQGEIQCIPEHARHYDYSISGPEEHTVTERTYFVGNADLKRTEDGQACAEVKQSSAGKPEAGVMEAIRAYLSEVAAKAKVREAALQSYQTKGGE